MTDTATTITDVVVDEPVPARTSGRKTAITGAGVALAGAAMMVASFYFFDRVSMRIAAPTLIGMAMLGYGLVEWTLGERLSWLRWVGAIVIGFVGMGAVLAIVEGVLGISVG